MNIDTNQEFNFDTPVRIAPVVAPELKLKDKFPKGSHIHTRWVKTMMRAPDKIGVYQVRDYFGRGVYYAHWNGSEWSLSSKSIDSFKKKNLNKTAYSYANQAKTWRGLTTEAFIKS